MRLTVLLLLLLLPTGQAAAADAAPDFGDEQLQRQAQQLMTQRINELRAAAGARPLHYDPVAGQAARLHATDMLTRGFFSHWNPEGLKPTQRYNLLGGFHALGENIYYYHGEFSSLEQMIDEALQKLMESEGHRRTLLDPSYTHVGIYFAASSRRRDLYIAQEFIARLGGEYRCAPRATLGQMVEFAGRFDPQRYRFENIIIGYEERPRPRDLLWLSRSGSYKDADKLVAGYTAEPGLEFRELPTLRDVEVNAEEGWFKSGLRFNYKGREGLYYVFLWLRDLQRGEAVLAATVTVEVSQP